MYCVYRHTSPSGKVYVGITKQAPERRWQNGFGYSQNKLFTRAIEKYGWDSFKHEVLQKDLTKEEAEKLERELIAKHKSNDSSYGYNIMPGGANAWWFGKKLSDEHRKKATQRHIGETNPHAKKVICLETLTVYGTMAQAQEATGATKICDCCRGYYKHRTSAGLHWSYYDSDKPLRYYEDLLARMVEEESKQRTMSEVNKKKLIERSIVAVVCVETQEVFPSIREAAKKVGASPSNICNCCRGKKKTTAGFHWQYAVA